MTDPSTGERASATGATTTSPTGSRRDADQTGDAARGTDSERGHERSCRLCDRGLSRSDPASLVAYVELPDDGVYEVVWVSVGLGTAYYPSLEELFLAAIERLDGSRSLGAVKPEPIPHRPPARI